MTLEQMKELAEKEYPEMLIADGVHTVMTDITGVVRHAFLHGLQYDRWIPCTERLPTKEDADGKLNVLGWDNIQKETHKCFYKDIRDMKIRFTHWQPLPKSPTK